MSSPDANYPQQTPKCGACGSMEPPDGVPLVVAGEHGILVFCETCGVIITWVCQPD